MGIHQTINDGKGNAPTQKNKKRQIYAIAATIKPEAKETPSPHHGRMERISNSGGKPPKHTDSKPNAPKHERKRRKQCNAGQIKQPNPATTP